MSRITEYGFEIGALQVDRLAETRRGASIEVKTPYRSVEITATPKGREMIVWMPEDAEPYSQFVVMAPNGVRVRIHGNKRYGYHVAAYDEKGYLHSFMLEREEKP